MAQYYSQLLQNKITRYNIMIKLLFLTLNTNPIEVIRPLMLILGAVTTIEVFSGFSVDGIPDYRLLLWFGLAIIIDLLTGIGKAIALKQQRTSEGYRKTVIKFIQYGGAMVIAIIISSVATQQNINVAPYTTFLGNTLVVWFIYIELTSICENLIAIDPKSKTVKFIIRPLYKLLTVQLTEKSSVEDLVEKDKGLK